MIGRVLWTLAAIVALGLLLEGCATDGRPAPEPAVRTVTITLPGELRPCVPKELRDPPAYVDTAQALEAAADAAARYQLVTAGRAQREGRLAEIEPILKGCR